MASDTPLTDNVQNKHAMQWFGIHAPIDRSMDEANKMREYARDLERVARQMAEASIEFFAAADNSMIPKDGDDVAAMLRYAKADKAARQALAAFRAFEEKYK